MERGDSMRDCGAANGPVRAGVLLLDHRGVKPLPQSTEPTDPSGRKAPPTKAPTKAARTAVRGFSLIEILLVVALIGLLSAVLVSGARGLLNDKPQTPEEIFWSAVQEARKKALETEGEVTMRFNDEREKGKSFVLVDNTGTKSIPVPDPGDLEVAFLTTQKGGNMIMIGGTVVETQKVESVRFYPDGTCSPFRIQFLQKGASEVLSIDPWTCAPVLLPGDPNAPTRPTS